MQIIFFVSLVITVFLLLSKHVALKKNKDTFVQKFFGAFDGKTESLLDKIKNRLFGVIQNVRFVIFVKMPEKSKVSYHEAKEVALREYKRKKEILMGRKVIRKNGATSFFLRRIKEDVKKGEGGKIEESL